MYMTTLFKDTYTGFHFSAAGLRLFKYDSYGDRAVVWEVEYTEVSNIIVSNFSAGVNSLAHSPMKSPRTHDRPRQRIVPLPVVTLRNHPGQHDTELLDPKRDGTNCKQLSHLPATHRFGIHYIPVAYCMIIPLAKFAVSPSVCLSVCAHV